LTHLSSQVSDATPPPHPFPTRRSSDLGTTVDVLLTNEHDLNSGHFSVVKALEGSGAGLVPERTEFTVEYSYPAGNGFEAGKGELDRKSTRLNSSHVSISYAVFCLKKTK